MLARNPPPDIGSGIKSARRSKTLGCILILLHDLDNLLLDIGKGLEWNVRNLVLNAVLFQTKALASEQDVGLASSGEVGDTVADEDDEGDGAVFAFELGLGAGFLDGAGFVVAQVTIVEPEGFPLRAGGVYLGVVGDDVDMCGLNAVSLSAAPLLWSRVMLEAFLNV